MMYLRWALLAPIALLGNLFVIFTSPIWAFWAAAFKLEKLPGRFALVHTHDDDIYGWIPMPARFIDRFKTALWWLCRNPSYGFDTFVLGFKDSGGAFILSDSNPSALFDTGETVSRLVIMRGANGRKYFCYRRDQMLFGKRWCKIFIGWHYNVLAGGRHMIKVMVNPLRSR